MQLNITVIVCHCLGAGGCPRALPRAITPAPPSVMHTGAAGWTRSGLPAPELRAGPGSWTSLLPSHHLDGRLPSQPLCHLVLFCGCSDQPQQQRGGTAQIPAHSHGWAQREQTRQKGTGYRNTQHCHGGHFLGWSGLAKAVAQTLCPPGRMELRPHPWAYGPHKRLCSPAASS